MFPADRFPCLNTERLLLREIRPSDREALLASYTDPEVGSWFLDDPRVTAELADEIVGRFIQSYEERVGITWAITSKQSGELLGTCGYERVEIGSEGEVGFDLARAYWGRGLMTEALRAVLAYGFGTMGLQRIMADTRSDNERAIRLLERLGFCGEPECDGSSRRLLTSEGWSGRAA